MNAIIAVIILFSLSACKKENTNSSSPLYQATVTGKAWATFDQDASNAVQPVAGAKIYAVINTKDLVINSDANLTYANKIYTTTTASDGTFAFTIDTNIKDVTVSFYSDDIVRNLSANSKTTSTIWTIDPTTFSVTVTKDVYRVIDLQFTSVGTKN